MSEETKPEDYVSEYISEDMAAPRMRGAAAVIAIVVVTLFILFIVGSGFATL